MYSCSNLSPIFKQTTPSRVYVLKLNRVILLQPLPAWAFTNLIIMEIWIKLSGSSVEKHASCAILNCYVPIKDYQHGRNAV